MIRLASAIVLGALGLASAVATATGERAGPAAADAKVVQDCLKSERGNASDGEACIGVVTDPCMADDTKPSTADQVECASRETLVWDRLLNTTYRGLRESLDNKQRVKLRDMQRAWVTARDKTCGFYWDFHQGTMAAPMEAYCTMRETARRALFLKRFHETER